MSTWRENMPWNCERKTWTPIRSGWGHRLVRVKAQHFSWCIVFIWLKTTQQSAGLMFKPKIQLCSITGNHLNVCLLQKQRKTTKSHCVSTQISNLKRSQQLDGWRFFIKESRSPIRSSFNWPSNSAGIHRVFVYINTTKPNFIEWALPDTVKSTAICW